MSFIKSGTKQSLTRTTLIKMGIRIALIIIAVTLLSYWHVMSNLELQVIEQLDKYITERGYRDSSLLKLAEANHITFKNEFLRRYKATINEDFSTSFNQVFESHDDGIIRMRTKYFHGVPLTEGAKITGMSGFIQKNVAVTNDLQRRLIIGHNMASIYGPTWENRFPDLYLSVPEKAVVVYWPKVIWVPEKDSNVDYFVTDEPFYIGNPEHNSQREIVWSGIYYEEIGQEWLVSCVTPVDFNGQHIATVGSDILLSELFERTINDHLEGAYNIIFQPNGRLIAHYNMMKAIQSSNGNLYIQKSQDQNLINIFEHVTKRQSEQVVIENSKNDELLAITKIEGPDWYLVTVYPKSLLTELAFDTARFILFLGILSLLIEITVLFLVLRKQVAQPLQDFLGATQQIASGNFNIEATQHLPLKRHDEIGKLAQSFNGMAGQLKTSFDTLDAKVIDRTAQLNDKIGELTQTRHELVQSEKMASLGRLVAGFAHELNTPLGVALSSASLLQRKMIDLNQLMEQDEVDEDDLLSVLDSIDKATNLNVSNLKRAANLVTSFKRTAIDQTSDKVRSFEVKQLIQDTINTLHSRFKKTEIEISMDCPKDLKVKSLPGALEQILTNLLMNSLIHGFNEGQDVGSISIKAQLDGDNLHLEYSDNGKGIASENLEKIFEPFFTTHRAHGGSGLGMYICYNLVTTQLLGTITCESQLGQGVVFKIDYPV